MYVTKELDVGSYQEALLLSLGTGVYWEISFWKKKETVLHFPAEFHGLHRSLSVRNSHSLSSHFKLVCVQNYRFTFLSVSGAELLGCSFSS